MAYQNQDHFSNSAESEIVGGLGLWRDQLLTHQTEGDAEGIELDRQILDYYLDEMSKSRLLTATR